jgi:hypothetical protein
VPWCLEPVQQETYEPLELDLWAATDIGTGEPIVESATMWHDTCDEYLPQRYGWLDLKVATLADGQVIIDHLAAWRVEDLATVKTVILADLQV